MFKILIWTLILTLIILEIILIKKLVVRLQKRKIKVEVIDYMPPEEKSYTVPIILLIILALVSAFFMYASIFPFMLICSSVLV